MRVAIIGSRNCPPIDIDSYLPEKPELIVSGGARGADTYAREYALKNDIPLLEFLPEYEKYGRKAPLLRNIQIIDNCDFVLAFWDGLSRGTKFTLDYAYMRGISIRIISITIGA